MGHLCWWDLTNTGLSSSELFFLLTLGTRARITVVDQLLVYMYSMIQLQHIVTEKYIFVDEEKKEMEEDSLKVKLSEPGTSFKVFYHHHKNSLKRRKKVLYVV